MRPCLSGSIEIVGLLPPSQRGHLHMQVSIVLKAESISLTLTFAMYPLSPIFGGSDVPYATSKNMDTRREHAYKSFIINTIIL